jgi:hypothetical protein
MQLLQTTIRKYSAAELTCHRSYPASNSIKTMKLKKLKEKPQEYSESDMHGFNVRSLETLASAFITGLHVQNYISSLV